MYVNMLAERDLMLRFNNNGVPALGGPRHAPRLPARRPLGGEGAGHPAGHRGRRTRRSCGASSTSWPSLLSDGRPHLCGERFTAADLTFGALSASVIVPPVYGTPLPQPDVLPPHIAALVNRAREHPAGRYALSLYDRR